MRGIAQVLIFLLAAAGWAAGGEGVLRVKTDVSEVEVFVDGKSVGTTPATITAPAGTHQLTLAKNGYKDHTQAVEIRAGGTEKLFIVMKAEERPLPPLPAKFTAIHGHATGICRGEMTVTADALDYRAKDSHDAFHIPMAEIKAVTRSYGASGDWGPGMRPVEAAGLRIDGPGREYTFWVYEDEPEGSNWKGYTIDPYMAQKTKELYELVNRLWQKALEERRARQGKK